MRGRTIFLDVVDPSLPPDVQQAIHEQLDELRDFEELKPSIWKRVRAACAWKGSDRLPTVVKWSGVLEHVAVIGAVGGCLCGV